MLAHARRSRTYPHRAPARAQRGQYARTDQRATGAVDAPTCSAANPAAAAASTLTALSSRNSTRVRATGSARGDHVEDLAVGLDQSQFEGEEAVGEGFGDRCRLVVGVPLQGVGVREAAHRDPPPHLGHQVQGIRRRGGPATGRTRRGRPPARGRAPSRRPGRLRTPPAEHRPASKLRTQRQLSQRAQTSSSEPQPAQLADRARRRRGR